MNQRLKDILVDELNLNPSALLPESRLEDAGLDSLTLVELSVQLQETAGVAIGEDELASASTVGALDRLVAARLGDR